MSAGMCAASRQRTALAVVALALLTHGLVGPRPLAAQRAEEHAARCGDAGGEPGLCALAAGGARDLMGDVALLFGAGSEIPGQSSTLGRRVGGMLRLAPYVRAGGHSLETTDMGDPTGSTLESAFVPSLHAGLGAGLFDGFRLLPTVGGFLSLDVVGQASFAFLPEEKGFGGRVDAISLGARVGILRESFTLPGVTLSYARRMGEVARLGDGASGDSAELVVDPTVDSWRVTVGKDLFAFGVSAGMGWDDIAGETLTVVSDGGGGFVRTEGQLNWTRRAYHVGLSRQLGVLSWISAEMGWAEGENPVTGGAVSSPDRGRTLYGSVSVLLKL